jgi:hypothetical protein
VKDGSVLAHKYVGRKRRLDRSTAKGLISWAGCGPQVETCGYSRWAPSGPADPPESRSPSAQAQPARSVRTTFDERADLRKGKPFRKSGGKAACPAQSSGRNGQACAMACPYLVAPNIQRPASWPWRKRRQAAALQSFRICKETSCFILWILSNFRDGIASPCSRPAQGGP